MHCRESGCEHSLKLGWLDYGGGGYVVFEEQRLERAMAWYAHLDAPTRLGGEELGDTLRLCGCWFVANVHGKNSCCIKFNDVWVCWMEHNSKEEGYGFLIDTRSMIISVPSSMT